MIGQPNILDFPQQFAILKENVPDPMDALVIGRFTTAAHQQTRAPTPVARVLLRKLSPLLAQSRYRWPACPWHIGSSTRHGCQSASVASVWALFLIRFSPFVRPIIRRPMCGSLGAGQLLTPC